MSHIPCRNFASGRCKQGDKCAFGHSGSGSVEYPVVSAEKSGGGERDGHQSGDDSLDERERVALAAVEAAMRQYDGSSTTSDEYGETDDDEEEEEEYDDEDYDEEEEEEDDEDDE